MPPMDQEAVLRALWRDKMHVEPRALELAPAAVRRSFEHAFHPTTLVLDGLRDLPTGLLRLWWACPRGHVVFTHLPSRYAPGPQPWRDGTLTAVAYVSIVELRPELSGADPFSPWRALLDLIDHLLGGACDAARPRFSQGAGITPDLADAARRFAEIAALGYAAEEPAPRMPARTWRAPCGSLCTSPAARTCSTPWRIGCTAGRCSPRPFGRVSAAVRLNALGDEVILLGGDDTGA